MTTCRCIRSRSTSRIQDEFKALEKRKVELAAQRVREAKEQIEREERKAKKLKADHLWAEAKQCWRVK